MVKKKAEPEAATNELRFVVRNRDVGGTLRPTRILQQRWTVGAGAEWRDVPEVKED